MRVNIIRCCCLLHSNYSSLPYALFRHQIGTCILHICVRSHFIHLCKSLHSSHICIHRQLRDGTQNLMLQGHLITALRLLMDGLQMGRKRANWGPEVGPRYNLRSAHAKTIRNATTTDRLTQGCSVEQATYSQRKSYSGILMEMSKPKAANPAGGLPPEVGDREPKTFVGQALLDALEHSCTSKQDGMVEAQPIHGSQASKRKNGRRRKPKGAKHLHTLLQSPWEQRQHVALFEPPKIQHSISARSAENRQALPIRQNSTAHVGWQTANHDPARTEMSMRYQPMQNRSQNQVYPTQQHLTGQYHGLGQGLWPLPASLSANAGPFTSSAFMPPSFQYAQQNPLFTPYTPLLVSTYYINSLRLVYS